VALSAAAWWMGRQAKRSNDAQSVKEVERKIDRLKDKAFYISLVLTFFIITPFVVLFVFVKPG
jgi:predicted MFS family arabinose efflux permease